MGVMIGTGKDVVSFLKSQHEQIKGLFTEVISASGPRRKEAFFDLRRLMAVHETAEEEIVHPAARRAVPNGENVVAARLREENEAKKALTRLETLDPASAEFDQEIRVLQTNVLAHAAAEESNEFEPLGKGLDAERLERMRRAVELAERIAPTRPHAGVESAAANFLAGPFASMIDRARDALSTKT